VNKAIVVTTIHSPSKAVKQFSNLTNWQLISVGDLKTPGDWQVPNVDYLAPKDQDKLFPKFSALLGWNRYARKNIGYLYAIKNGAKIIAEIDDDIAPYKTYPPQISENKNIPLISGEKFVNIYNLFGSKDSWPRGFPITKVTKKQRLRMKKAQVYSPIQNSLYCPFHSGNTFWYPPVFMLLYLPTYTNPHVEDIWRSYIAQRLMWEINGHLTFIYPTVYTNQRNKHNYLKDFEYELPLFLQTEKLIKVLNYLSLNNNLGSSLIKIYQALVKEGIMKKEELATVTEWIKQVEKLG